jgi:hypothetical protein
MTRPPRRPKTAHLTRDDHAAREFIGSSTVQPPRHRRNAGTLHYRAMKRSRAMTAMLGEASRLGRHVRKRRFRPRLKLLWLACRRLYLRALGW